MAARPRSIVGGVVRKCIDEEESPSPDIERPTESLSRRNAAEQIDDTQSARLWNSGILSYGMCHYFMFLFGFELQFECIERESLCWHVLVGLDMSVERDAMVDES